MVQCQEESFKTINYLNLFGGFDCTDWHRSPGPSVKHIGDKKKRSRGTWWRPPEDHFAPSSTSRSVMYGVNTWCWCMTSGLNQQGKYMDYLHCEDFFSNIVLRSIPHIHYKTHQILLRFLLKVSRHSFSTSNFIVASIPQLVLGLKIRSNKSEM